MKYSCCGKVVSSVYLTWWYGLVSHYIVTSTKWLPFCWQHIQIHFIEWRLLHLIQISLKFVPKDLLDNKWQAFVQVMAWLWAGDKLLSAPMMAYCRLKWTTITIQENWFENIISNCQLFLCVNLLRLEQNGCHLADNIFIFFHLFVLMKVF